MLFPLDEITVGGTIPCRSRLPIFVTGQRRLPGTYLCLRRQYFKEALLGKDVPAFLVSVRQGRLGLSQGKARARHVLLIV